MKTEKIVLDTNFLVDNLKYKTRVFCRLRNKTLLTIQPVITELAAIAKGKSKSSLLAKLALSQIEKKPLKVLKTKETSADPALLSLSKKGYIIATHDKVLKQKIKKAGGKIIFIRQKKYVVME